MIGLGGLISLGSGMYLQSLSNTPAASQQIITCTLGEAQNLLSADDATVNDGHNTKDSAVTVELKGKIQALHQQDLLTSPLTHRKCVSYEILVERVYESCDPFILNGLSDPNHAMLTSPRAKNQGLARSKDRLWRWQRKHEQVYRARTSTDFVLTDTSGSVRVSQAAVLGMQDDILITTGSRFVTASGMQEKTLTIGEFSVAIADFTSHFLEIPERSRLIGYRCTERVLPINVNAFARGQLTQIAPQGEIILDKGTQSPFVLSLKPGHLVEIHNSGSSSGTRNMSYVSYLAGISLLGYYFLQSTAAAATDRLVRG